MLVRASCCVEGCYCEQDQVDLRDEAREVGTRTSGRRQVRTTHEERDAAYFNVIGINRELSFLELEGFIYISSTYYLSCM